MESQAYSSLEGSRLSVRTGVRAEFRTDALKLLLRWSRALVALDPGADPGGLGSTSLQLGQDLLG